MKTEICLTVDVEFSIAGAFGRPDIYSPIGEQSVMCEVDGRSEGLGCLIDILDEYETKATFFVDTAQSVYFGEQPMGAIANAIAQHGHDIQLHLHPCWMTFKDSSWKTKKNFHPSDSCAGRTDQEMDEFISHGLDTFAKWQLPRPIALRCGNFMADNTTYRAMRRAGLTLASNVALGTGESAIVAANGRFRVEGIIEVPCFAYRTPSFKKNSEVNWRHMSITSTSRWEINDLLWRARRESVETIVVLLHPFELIKKDNFRYENIRPNFRNRARLTGLLDFVRDNSSDFYITTFGAREKDWAEVGDLSSKSIVTSYFKAIARMTENFINDRM